MRFFPLPVVLSEEASGDRQKYRCDGSRWIRVNKGLGFITTERSNCRDPAQA